MCCVKKNQFMHTQESAELFYELQSEGYRMTKLRQAIVLIFSRQPSPLSLEELTRALKNKLINVHRASLYRELDFLKKKQIIVPVAFGDGKQRYEMADREHHHHVVCLSCKKIDDVELDNESDHLTKLIKTKSDFQILKHSLEFFGLCGNCKSV